MKYNYKYKLVLFVNGSVKRAKSSRYVQSIYLLFFCLSKMITFAIVFILNKGLQQVLVLYHSSDNNLKDRKKLYTEEAKQYFNGNIFVPDDLNVIEL